MVLTLGNSSGVLFKKLDMHLSYDSVIPLLGIYSLEMKADVHAKTQTGKFMAALLVIAKTGNTPNVHKEVSG